MTTETVDAERDALWARHHAEWRDTAQIASQWREADRIDPRLLLGRARGDWWETLARLGITLLVTREYEHLIMALGADGETTRPRASFLPLPHPSGLAADRERGVVHVASTRNPNQVYDLMPVLGQTPRLDLPGDPTAAERHPLVPVRSRFLPGCLYMHDLARIGDDLYANSVGQNAIVRLREDGRAERVWWPRAIETAAGPIFGRNHLQLNSIAAGASIEESFFSASTDAISVRRPGHRNFAVDRRGVVFSGRTREPILSGLTRPHSARLHGGRVWVDNSGYGELGFADGNGRLATVARMPGWTRGLCFHGQIAFVGTSRVIPRFRRYAPGLDVDASICGVHAVDTETGRTLGSLIWPYGNQIFALDWMPGAQTAGFPFPAGKGRATEREKRLFYTFDCFGGQN